ncbi:MAG: PilZ domain-containing protein, partial [Acidobacteria bacterium]|nr:PilZ domain-containing protein [Acidobacteriota bacterium]
RPEPRVDSDLSIRAWGIDAAGKPFTQLAKANNISSQGALISGIDATLKPGDIIGIQYQQKKARCRVIWVLDAGGILKTRAGLQLVEGQECPWKDILMRPPAAGAATGIGSNRRGRQRHKMSFPLELRDERTKVPIRVNATDISGSGCYIETLTPFPIGTNIQVEFWMEQQRINTTALVRTSDPAVGMGLEFVGLAPDVQERLQHFLDKRDPVGIAGPPHSSPAS